MFNGIINRVFNSTYFCVLSSTNNNTSCFSWSNICSLAAYNKTHNSITVTHICYKLYMTGLNGFNQYRTKCQYIQYFSRQENIRFPDITIRFTDVDFPQYGGNSGSEKNPVANSIYFLLFLVPTIFQLPVKMWRYRWKLVWKQYKFGGIFFHRIHYPFVFMNTFIRQKTDRKIKAVKNYSKKRYP